MKWLRPVYACWRWKVSDPDHCMEHLTVCDQTSSVDMEERCWCLLYNAQRAQGIPQHNRLLTLPFDYADTIGWMCGIKLKKDRLPSKESRETRYRWHSIGIAAEQAALVWACAAKRRDDWVKKCMEYELEGPRPRGRPKRTWREVLREDCQARKMNKEDATDRCKWRKMIKDVQWSGWVWVGECFFWYWPTRVVPDQRLLNGCVYADTVTCWQWQLHKNVTNRPAE